MNCIKSLFIKEQTQTTMTNTIYPQQFTENWNSFNDYMEQFGWIPYKEIPDDFYESIADNMHRYTQNLVGRFSSDEWDDSELYEVYIDNCYHGGYMIEDFYERWR